MNEDLIAPASTELQFCIERARMKAQQSGHAPAGPAGKQQLPGLSGFTTSDPLKVERGWNASTKLSPKAKRSSAASKAISNNKENLQSNNTSSAGNRGHSFSNASSSGEQWPEELLLLSPAGHTPF